MHSDMYAVSLKPWKPEHDSAQSGGRRSRKSRGRKKRKSWWATITLRDFQTGVVAQTCAIKMETFQAEMKAAEEQRQREEEEERREAAEKRREEKRREREVRRVDSCAMAWSPVWHTLHHTAVCSEGGGETEAAETAAGAHQAGPSTLPQNLVVMSRPGAMETPHSVRTRQHAGKSAAVSQQLTLSPLTCQEPRKTPWSMSSTKNNFKNKCGTKTTVSKKSTSHKTCLMRLKQHYIYIYLVLSLPTSWPRTITDSSSWDDALWSGGVTCGSLCPKERRVRTNFTNTSCFRGASTAGKQCVFPAHTQIHSPSCP